MRIYTRRVVSGSFPLYRLMVAGVLVSAMLQIIYQKVPESVEATSPRVFDYVYLVAQAGGAVVLLGSMYTRRPLLSLNLERFGAATLAMSCALYVAAAVLNNSGPPLSSGVWLVVALLIYLVWRAFRDIPRDLRVMEQTAQAIIDSEEDRGVG